MATDVYLNINEVSGEMLEKVINRLEFRDTDPTFSGWINTYLAKLPLDRAERVLDVGCGTGVVARRIAMREEFSGEVIGLDQGTSLIEAAREIAKRKVTGVNNLRFEVGDCHSLAYNDNTFNIVVAHTLVSHVTDVERTVQELVRVAKPGGVIAIFDGDYASWTFAYPEPRLARKMEQALLAATFANFDTMRFMPVWLKKAGAEIIETLVMPYAEVGQAKYWKSLVETYGARIAPLGLLSQAEVDKWMNWMKQASDEGTFFGMSNYFTYIALKKG
jgi:ubiquinone/menaquinone biosynthesis C-methylase UbiE